MFLRTWFREWRRVKKYRKYFLHLHKSKISEYLKFCIILIGLYDTCISIYKNYLEYLNDFPTLSFSELRKPKRSLKNLFKRILPILRKGF